MHSRYDRVLYCLTLQVHPEICRDIIVLRLIPGMYSIFLESISELKPLKGLIIEAFGTGTASTHEHSKLLEMIKRCIVNDVVVVVTSQCQNGTFTSYFIVIIRWC